MSTEVAGQIRKHYRSLIDGLLMLGEADHARACAESAVELGVWNHPLLRPEEFDARLPSRPVYDPAAFWFTSYLEEHYEVIRDEVLRVMADPASAGFSPVEEQLVGRGRWDEVMFYEDGVRMEQPCARFPETAAIVSRIPEAVHSGGVIMLSWLHPGTHIVPHCGGSNTRLRVHFAIRIPPGATMRVGETLVEWEEGKCVVFDDSFEHEVWNRAASERVVLLFDVLHPNLPAAEVTARRERQTSLEESVRTFLTTRGIAGVTRDPRTDALTVLPDDWTTKTITRYMKDHDVTRVQVARESLTIE
jgi:aspartate beta-hydroxylase